jgi:hypothetical protein
MKKQKMYGRASSIRKQRLALERSVIRSLTEPEAAIVVAGVQPATGTCCGVGASGCKPAGG